MVANFVLASLQPCDVPTTVRLGFSLTAASLPTILNILDMKSPHHSMSMFSANDEATIRSS